MHNNRELELQAINKTLQSKLQSLRRELAHKDQQIKMAETLKTDNNIVEEKDKTIQFLMNSIKKLKEENAKYHMFKITQLADDFNQTQTNNKQLRTSNNNLQQQLVLQRQNYQKILTHKQAELKQVKLSCQALQNQRKKWVQQAQKINRFHAQALRRQPEREQTLLWVDKLIQFMSKASEIVISEKNQRNQAVQNLKKNLKEQFYQINNLLNRNQTQLTSQKNSFLKQLQRVLEAAESDYRMISKSNEQFWQNFNKVRSREQKESFSKLQQQFESYKIQKQKQFQELSDVVTNCQKQKKSFLVSIQQMKSYYQLREKALKQQADILKQTISDLIQGQQVREKQFQKEIQRLGNLIQHLTIRFYQKIQLPINSVYTKIKQEVQNFKNHFQNFFSGNNIQTQITQFHGKIVDYLIYLNQYKGLRQLMKDSVHQCLKIAEFLKPIQKVNEKTYQSVDKSIIGGYSSVGYRSGISVQTSRQKQLKMNYELATVKKQLQKMKQYVKQLQKKSGSRSSSFMNSKYVQLMAQNQAYKQRIQKFQRNEKEGFAFSNQFVQQSRIGRINTAILQRLVEKCQLILLYTEKQQKYILQLSSCINSLNLIIINPLENFQNLIIQIKNISSFAINPPMETKQSQKFVNFDLQKKKQLFKQITFKKNEAVLNIQKSNLQLTKTIREFLSKNSIKNSKDSEQKQPEKFKSYQSRQMLEKRLKQAHNHRLKNRQDFILSLRQLEQKVKTIESRYTKRQNTNFIKFQESILKSIEQMNKVTEPKQKFKETKKIVDQALLDVKSKLENCKIENQGLIREIEMLKLIKTAVKPANIAK